VGTGYGLKGFRIQASRFPAGVMAQSLGFRDWGVGLIKGVWFTNLGFGCRA
jgi:hypothetical protein